MNELCDRCHGQTRATHYVTNGMARLFFCTHCLARHREALDAKGWTIWPIGYQAVAPQAVAVS